MHNCSDKPPPSPGGEENVSVDGEAKVKAGMAKGPRERERGEKVGLEEKKKDASGVDTVSDVPPVCARRSGASMGCRGGKGA